METDILIWAGIILFMFMASSVMLGIGLFKYNNQKKQDRLIMLGMIGQVIANIITFVMAIYFFISWIF